VKSKAGTLALGAFEVCLPWDYHMVRQSSHTERPTAGTPAGGSSL
jgi:hypothetical protein